MKNYPVGLVPALMRDLVGGCKAALRAGFHRAVGAIRRKKENEKERNKDKFGAEQDALGRIIGLIRK